MPDVANALKFQKKMIGVEQAYLVNVRRHRRNTRRVLLDIIDRDGISRSAIAQMRAAIDALGREITLEAQTTAREAKRIVGIYLNKQVQLVRRMKLADMDTNVIIGAGAGAERDAEESYMTNTSAWLDTLQAQIQTQSARLRLSNADTQAIIARLLSTTASDGRSSVWGVSEAQAQTEETTNLWNYSGSLLAVYLGIFGSQQSGFQKQAIATIDERTTDCCLRVHGQTKPLDEPFKLTGTPRFADEIQDPPFHWYCRTSEALYHPEFEQFGIPTQQMIDAAQYELLQREKTRERVTIYPSHATARRAT